MITRMEITYCSKEPCNVKPEIFSTGGYSISQNGVSLHFDFEEMCAGIRLENGYLYIDSMQKNLDETVSEGVPTEVIDSMIRSAKKEDFTEIYYECWEDSDEETPIELRVEKITFYDYSETGDGEPIVVGGDSFCNLA